MNWFFGQPKYLARLGEYSYRYKGQVDFQVARRGTSWYCSGFPVAVTLQMRATERNGPFADSELGPYWELLSTTREDGWGSFTKAGCLRKVCRSIERSLTEAMDEDARYLEAKGVRLRA